MSIRHYSIDKNSAATEVCSLWPSLTDAQCALISEHLHIVRYKKNDIIYSEKDSPSQMFFLLSGKVKVLKDGVGGRNQIVRVVKPVEMFGYRAYFAEASHHPEMSLQVVRHLSILLGQSDDRTVNLTQKHIRGRLAEAILFLKENYGVEEDGCTLSIYLSREDLANLSNMTTSNAIRTLSSFAVEKIIAIDGKKIKIVQEEELRKVSKMG